MKINPDIFRLYDVRGVAGKDLSPETANAIGRAFGTYLLEKGTKDVLLGRDIRESSQPYHKAASQGLVSTGCNVFDLGVTLSPFLYFARQHYKMDGGLMVTASHNPKDWNGFKFCHGLNAISQDEVQKIRRITLSEKFASGKGRVKSLDVVPEYFKAIKKMTKLRKRLKVVVDGGDNTPGLFMPKLLENLGCEVAAVHCEPDSSFPRGSLDPADQNHYKELVSAVKKHKADAGVLLDADGDRVGFVDEKGNVLPGDVILTLLIRDIVPLNPGRKVVIEIKNSEIVSEETERLGGIPVFWKTGHALLDPKVYEEKAILCGELSCHYWITDNWYWFDDAPHASARILEIVSRNAQTLSELVSKIPRYPSTTEYRIDCPEGRKFETVRELVEYFRPKCTKVIDVDGIRGYVGDGWFLIRASNTQPKISVRAEAKTEQGLEKIKSLVGKKINEYPFLSLEWKGAKN